MGLGCSGFVDGLGLGGRVWEVLKKEGDGFCVK